MRSRVGNDRVSRGGWISAPAALACLLALSGGCSAREAREANINRVLSGVQTCESLQASACRMIALSGYERHIICGDGVVAGIQKAAGGGERIVFLGDRPQAVALPAHFIPVACDGASRSVAGRHAPHQDDDDLNDDAADRPAIVRLGSGGRLEWSSFSVRALFTGPDGHEWTVSYCDPGQEKGRQLCADGAIASDARHVYLQAAGGPGRRVNTLYGAGPQGPERRILEGLPANFHATSAAFADRRLYIAGTADQASGAVYDCDIETARCAVWSARPFICNQIGVATGKASAARTLTCSVDSAVRNQAKIVVLGPGADKTLQIRDYGIAQTWPNAFELTPGSNGKSIIFNTIDQ
jgi:hypothetical protein